MYCALSNAQRCVKNNEFHVDYYRILATHTTRQMFNFIELKKLYREL